MMSATSAVLAQPPHKDPPSALTAHQAHIAQAPVLQNVKLASVDILRAIMARARVAAAHEVVFAVLVVWCCLAAGTTTTRLGLCSHPHQL